MHIQVCVCVLLGIFAIENDVARTCAENTLITSFAINSAVLVGRVQGRISPRNVGMGANLGVGLCAAGTYYLVIRYRYSQPNQLSEHGIHHLILTIIWALSFLTGIVSTVVMFWILRHWRFMPHIHATDEQKFPFQKYSMEQPH